MPDPRNRARLASARRLQQDTQPHRSIANLRNGRLHLALLLALAAAFLIALAVPITRTRASSEERPATSALVTSDELAATLRTQASVQRQQAVPFTLHEQGFLSTHLSSGLTVSQALADLGIKIGPYDLITPSPETALTSGLHVYLRYANQVNLSAGSQHQTVYTHAATVGDLLAEIGVELEPLDRVSPGPAQAIRYGMSVDITIVRESIEYVDELLPFTTIYWDDPDLLQGNEMLIQAGSAGYLRREYRVLYENGREISRQFVAETTDSPVYQIIAQGSNVPATPAPATPTIATAEGDLECSRTMNVYATWYTAASAGGSGTTATGTDVYKGIVAVDPSVIPLGTWMYIPGYGYGLAADTGGAIIGNMIDLGYGPNDIYDWATRWVEICILV